MKDIYHVVVTRFSIRMHPEGALRGKSLEWLFDKDRLLQKLILFEHIALASLAKGSEQPDLLLVLIDKELPETIRQQLENIIEPYHWAQTFELEPGALANMSHIGSLLGGFAIDSKYILTTNLDDDDAIGTHYIQNLKSLVKQHRNENPNQPFHWFGSIDMQEWDILPSNEAALGFLKPYSGGVLFSLSTGFSVLSKNHPYGPNIFLLPHNFCLDFLTLKHRRENYNRRGRFKFRVRLALNALKMGRWETVFRILRSDDFATRLDDGRTGQFQGLISNHGDNLQQGRIKSGISTRKPVSNETLQSIFNVHAQKVIDNF